MLEPETHQDISDIETPLRKSADGILIVYFQNEILNFSLFHLLLLLLLFCGLA